MIDLIVKCVYKAFHRNIFTKLIYNLYCKKRYINKGDLTWQCTSRNAKKAQMLHVTVFVFNSL